MIFDFRFVNIVFPLKLRLKEWDSVNLINLLIWLPDVEYFRQI